MRTVIAIQARLGSSRLPNKALLEVWGIPLISRMMKRLRTVKGVDGVIVACPEKDACAFKRATGHDPVTGPEQDVLTRIMNVVNETEASKIVKVGADCPLVPPDLIELAIGESKGQGIVQNTIPRTYPDGFDFEVWDVQLLKSLNELLTGEDREWFTSWALKNCESKFINWGENASRYRLTVDYPEDVEVLRSLYAAMGREEWGSVRLIDWCKDHPEIMKLNKHHVSNFGARPS